MGKTKILLGCKRHVFWEGLIKTLGNRPDIEVVAECSTGLETIRRTIELKPDIVFIDEIIQDCGFLEVAQQLKELLPEIHTVIVTKSRPSPEMLSVLKAEASAYIDKDIPVTALFTVIERIKEKGVTICPILADQLIKSFSLSEQSGERGNDENKLGLSRREEEVLVLVGQGATNKEIANALCITENTVKVHLASIFEKLKLHNRQDVAALARNKGFTQKS